MKMENKTIIILIILFCMAFLVSIFFPLPQPRNIQTDFPCEEGMSFDISNNLEEGFKQTDFCEEKCSDLGIDSSSSRCKDNKLICLCHP